MGPNIDGINQNPDFSGEYHPAIEYAPDTSGGEGNGSEAASHNVPQPAALDVPVAPHPTDEAPTGPTAGPDIQQPAIGVGDYSADHPGANSAAYQAAVAEYGKGNVEQAMHQIDPDNSRVSHDNAVAQAQEIKPVIDDAKSHQASAQDQRRYELKNEVTAADYRQNGQHTAAALADADAHRNQLQAEHHEYMAQGAETLANAVGDQVGQEYTHDQAVEHGEGAAEHEKFEEILQLAIKDLEALRERAESASKNADEIRAQADEASKRLRQQIDDYEKNLGRPYNEEPATGGPARDRDLREQAEQASSESSESQESAGAKPNPDAYKAASVDVPPPAPPLPPIPPAPESGPEHAGGSSAS